MKLFVIAVFLLWRLDQSSAANSIKIYPKEKYFGGSVTQVILTCQPTQSCGDTIKWFEGTTEVDLKLSKYSNATNYVNHYESLTISDLKDSDDETYHCQCTFNGISVNSPVSTLIYQDPVSFNNEDNQIYYAEMGKNVSLICEIDHYDNFQWQLPESTVIPSNNGKYTYIGNNLLISNLTVDDSTTFYCVGQNKVTFVAKLAAHVFVYKSPKVISTSSTEMSVDEGESITFNCTAEGHPLPVINWLRSGGALKIGPTVIVKTGGIDEFSQWSSLTLTHISASQAGNYLCSASSSTPEQSAAQTTTYTLNVNIPENPVFQIYTIDKSHSSINLTWLLSGVSSNMINVSWNTDNGITHQIHSSNLSSIVLTDLIPDTLYLINAIVIGTDLFDSINESTNRLAITSSSTQYPSTSTTVTYTTTSTPTTTVNERMESTSTSNAVRPTRITSSTVSTTPDETTSIRGGESGDKGLSTIHYAIIGVAVVLLLVILLVVVLVMKKRRKSKTRNIRSIEKAGSSRSSQVLLEPTNFMSSPSIHGSTTGSMYPIDGSMPPSYFEGTNTVSVNQATHTMNPSYKTKLPMSDEFMYNTPAAHYEPFEMTNNPNFVQSTQVAELPAYYPPLSGDSASQVMLSQSSHILDSSHQFEYTDSTIYEPTSIKKPQPILPPRSTNSSSNTLPVYTNQPTQPPAYGNQLQGNQNAKPKPEFGIVGNSQRGEVREHVVIKKR